PKRLASRTAGAQPTGGRSSDAPLELRLACVERVAERGVPRELVAGDRVQLEQPAQQRPCVIARQVAALDECDAMCEICQRQAAGETRTVSALRRIGSRHELARSAAAQTTTPPQLLCFCHEMETRGPRVRHRSVSPAVTGARAARLAGARRLFPRTREAANRRTPRSSDAAP